MGTLAGDAGLLCFIAAAVLSARVPGWDVKLGGLTKIWKAHHLLGAASFLLVMAHPLLLAFAARGQSWRAAAAVLFPPSAGAAVWAGWLAWAAMSVFLAPTFWFFGRPDYARWKALHAVSGPALVLALAHVLPLSRTPAARGLWFAAGALALLAFAYRTLIAPATARRAHVVAAVRAEGRGVVELTLKPEGAPLSYRSGQFIYLTPLDPGLAAGRGEEHPFTLSSSPDEPELRVMIKDLGDATHALQSVAAGSRALVEGPYGDFMPGRDPTVPELWIAGGVGLAPFLSAARSTPRGEARDVVLIYCVQDASRAFFRAELESLAARIPGFRFLLHEFAREGALNSAYLRARCPDAAARAAFVCGPAPLIDAARRELGPRLRAEDFSWL